MKDETVGLVVSMIKASLSANEPVPPTVGSVSEAAAASLTARIVPLFSASAAVDV